MSTFDDSYQKALEAAGNDPKQVNKIKVENVLKSVANTGKRIRIYHGDPETGRDWMEENDVSGYVGSSMGPQKIFILLPTKHSSSGGGIGTTVVMRIIQEPGREIYRHPKFKQATFTTADSPRTIGDKTHDGISYDRYKYGAFHDGQYHAGFSSDAKRKRWLDFMAGKRMTK